MFQGANTYFVCEYNRRIHQVETFGCGKLRTKPASVKVSPILSPLLAPFCSAACAILLATFEEGCTVPVLLKVEEAACGGFEVLLKVEDDEAVFGLAGTF